MDTLSPPLRPSTSPSERGRLLERLFAPVDIASLAIFRIAFGAIMLWETYRYFAGERIERYYLEPLMLFKYYGFEWVQPWSGDGMYWHFVLLGVLSTTVMLGLFYRLSTILLVPTFVYIFLLEQAKYLNHFYMISLVCVLMVFVPANRALSLDALISRGQRSDVVPAWTVWLLRAQLGIVYIYAAFAKMNPDWIRNQPVRMWLGFDSDRVFLWHGWPIGELFTREWFVQFYTWGGLGFDLLIVPALLWRRTRAAAFVVCVGFHLFNAWMYNIGIFPWFMIAATTIFFAPDWPRKVKLLFAPFGESEKPAIFPFPSSPLRKRVTVALLGSYLAVQLLFPFRHLLIPGNAHWTEEGHRWSWHMKLRDKVGHGSFIVTDPVTRSTEIINPDDYLSDRQVRKMICTPDMILQFAHFLADEWRAAGHEHVEVRALIRCSLNGRKPQLFVDPDVDLAAEQRKLWHVDWIVPLEDSPVP
jgi:vitamin K-dependent gamma-carboxylase